MSNVKLFDDNDITAQWNDDQYKWFFVVQDVIVFLTDTANSIDYWYGLKKRELENVGNELSTICRKLKFKAPNGEEYKV